MISGNLKETFICSVCKIPTQHLLENPDCLFEFTGAFSFLDSNKQLLERSRRRHHLIYLCVGCNEHTYFLFEPDTVLTVGTFGGGLPSQQKFPKRTLHRYPVPSISENHPSVPETVRKILLEAERCHTAKAPNATAAMARLAVDEIVRLKEGEGKDLLGRLNNLRDRRIISVELADIGHQIRQAGRNGVHAEWEDLEEHDAASVMYLLKELIREIYIAPAEREVRRLRAFGKKSNESKS